jgi:hypothetical protein
MDKRKFVRFYRRLFVRFGSPLPQHIGYTEDISREGLFIKSNVVFKSGTPLSIELKLAESNVVSLSGIVKWAKVVSPSMFHHARKVGFAVSLKHPPESYLAFIDALKVTARPSSAKPSAAPTNGADPDSPAAGPEPFRDAESIGHAADAMSPQAQSSRAKDPECERRANCPPPPQTGTGRTT